MLLLSNDNKKIYCLLQLLKRPILTYMFSQTKWDLFLNFPNCISVIFLKTYPLLLTGHKGLKPRRHSEAQLVDERRLVLGVDLHFDPRFKRCLVCWHEEVRIVYNRDSYANVGPLDLPGSSLLLNQWRQIPAAKRVLFSEWVKNMPENKCRKIQINTKNYKTSSTCRRKWAFLEWNIHVCSSRDLHIVVIQELKNEVEEWWQHKPHRNVIYRSGKHESELIN